MRITKQIKQDGENNEGDDGDDDGDDGEQQVTMDTPSPTAIEPPPEAFVEMTRVETNAVAVPLMSIADNNHSNNNNGTPLSSNDLLTTTTSNNNNTLSRTFTVYAPSTLGPGYTFPACVDGIDFIVTVPDGGVREGEPFTVPYPSPSSSSQQQQQQHNPRNGIEPRNIQNSLYIESTTNSAPTGRWRNELCDCCEVFCSGLFWQGYCCSVILMGQVMTRLRLNLCGQTVHVDGVGTTTTSTTRYDQTIYILLFLWLILLLLLFVAPEAFAYLCVPFAVFVAFLAASTRYTMRKRYQIPVSHCKGCFDGKVNDCCCGFWCLCPSVIQMARHTHNEKDYPYQCCSTTGLAPGIPV